MLSEYENVFWKCAMDSRFYLGKTEGLFCKNRSEGVRLDLSRRIEIGRWGLEEGGREMSGPWVDLVKVGGLFSKKATKGYVLI